MKSCQDQDCDADDGDDSDDDFHINQIGDLPNNCCVLGCEDVGWLHTRG